LDEPGLTVTLSGCRSGQAHVRRERWQRWKKETARKKRKQVEKPSLRIEGVANTALERKQK
jgi:hypothetical protein